MKTLIRLFFRTIHSILAPAVLVVEWAMRPEKPAYLPEKQLRLDQATASMALYQFRACPYCAATRNAVRRLGLNIETRDALNDPSSKQELIESGGRFQVPCLKIEDKTGKTRWLYESSEITEYLKQHFA